MSEFLEFPHINMHKDFPYLRIFKSYTSGEKEIYWIDIGFFLNSERKCLKSASTFFGCRNKYANIRLGILELSV